VSPFRSSAPRNALPLLVGGRSVSRWNARSQDTVVRRGPDGAPRFENQPTGCTPRSPVGRHALRNLAPFQR
jgi:hypothetical protein